MKLSEQESRWLSRWEKRERLWLPVTRWVCLSCGALAVLMGAALARKLHANNLDNPGAIALVAFLCFVPACIWIGVAVFNWRGDIKLRLLLRLIREHEDKDA